MLLALFLACPRGTPPEDLDDVALQPEPPVSTLIQGPPPPSPEEIRASYTLCHDRVEGKSSPGECKSDADCAAAGCSGEVCVTALSAPDIITTCEILACFAVLSHCGCTEGLCQWALAADARPLLRPNPVGLPQPH